MNRWRDLARRAAAAHAAGDIGDEFDEFDKSGKANDGNRLRQQACEGTSATFSTNLGRCAAAADVDREFVENVTAPTASKRDLNRLICNGTSDLSVSSNLSPAVTDVPVPDGERFEERAAIMEFDGGLPRPEAEAGAAAEQGFASAAALRAAVRP